MRLTKLAAGAAVLFFASALPASTRSGIHSHRARKGRLSGGNHRVRSHRSELPLIRLHTLEIYGPPAPESLAASPAAPETIGQIEVVDASSRLRDCPGQEIVAQACDESPDEIRSFRAPGGRVAQAVRRIGDLFRPKSAQSEVTASDVDVDELLAMNLEIPVFGVTPSNLRDSFLDARHSRRLRREHLALDIGAPKGTPVLATADGEIVRAARERRGGKAIYLRDASGRYLFYYCHLSRFAANLEAGNRVNRGDVIGYVGSTGNARGSHLHFSVTRLADDTSDLHRGLAVNPYLIFLFANNG